MSNPLSLVYDKLWDILEASTAFTTTVPAGNRRKRSTARPTELRLTAGKTPIVDIIPTQIHTQMLAASAASKVVAGFAIVVEANGAAWQNVMEVIWAIITAMHGWEAAMSSLAWNGVSFVISSRTTEPAPIKLGRETSASYTVVWSGEVWMWFPTNSL